MGIDSPAKSTTSQKWPDKPFVESKQRRSIVDEPSNVNEDKEQWRPKTYTLIPKLLSRPSFSYFSPCESTDENGNTYPEGGAQAWLVVLGSLCSMFSGFGVVNSIGVINAYITDHQLKHYSDSDISWVFSFYIFLVFFCGLQIGPIFDARGPRELILAGSICMVLSCFLLGICEEYWHFILILSLLGGLGGSLLFTPAVSAISHWFFRRRGAATGVAACGGSFGGVVFPLLLESLFPKVGWAWATRILGFLILTLCSIGVALTRSRLSAVDRAKAAAAHDPNTSNLPSPKTGTDWRAMLPSPRIFLTQRGHILLTAIGIFFIEWGLFTPLTYLPQYALSTGTIDAAFANQLIAIINAASCFGRFGPGLVADRLGRFNTMIATLVLCFLASFAFWLPADLLPHAESSARLGLTIVFTIVFGVASGSGISLTPICVGQLCDTRQYGRYYATCYTLVSFGTLTGIPIAGSLIGATTGPADEKYWGVILFTGLCYVASIVCFVWVRVARVGWGWRTVW